MMPDVVVSRDFPNPRVKTGRSGRLYSKPMRRAIIFDWHLERTGREPLRPNTYADTRDLKERLERKHYWEKKKLPTDLKGVRETDVVADRLDKHVDRPAFAAGSAETKEFLWKSRVHYGHAGVCADPVKCMQDEAGVDDFYRDQAQEEEMEKAEAAARKQPCVTARHGRRGSEFTVDRGTILIERRGRGGHKVDLGILEMQATARSPLGRPATSPDKKKSRR